MKLNKKGYMLVEIILASALAFGLAFFIIDLVIRLKNKNNDLLVETLITTDKTIITNKLMSYAQSETKDFDCNKLTITGNTVKYDDEVIDIITDYANVGELSCSTKAGKVSITIPISVPQMPNKDYDITFDYKYEIGDITPPTCTITVSGTTITATFQDNDGGSGVEEGSTIQKSTITGTGEYSFTAKDLIGNIGTCKINVVKTNSKDNYLTKNLEQIIVGADGQCYCRSLLNGKRVFGACSLTSGGGITCACPKNHEIMGNPLDNCHFKSSQGCTGGYKKQGNICIKKVSTTYYCNSGYIKINNSYCYIKTE